MVPQGFLWFQDAATAVTLSFVRIYNGSERFRDGSARLLEAS